jgi:hypothetical protein
MNPIFPIFSCRCNKDLSQAEHSLSLENRATMKSTLKSFLRHEFVLLFKEAAAGSRP